MGHFDEVEEAWSLSDAAREYAAQAEGELSSDDYLSTVFAASPQIDLERTQREGGHPVQRIFLKTPYGLQWRPQHKDWIPFRHGDIDLNNI